MAEYDYSTESGRRDAIRDYLNRSDLTETQLDFFLGAGLRKLARRLRARQNETTVTYAGDATLTIPADYIEARSFTCDGHPLQRISDVQLQCLIADGATGFPEKFGRVGNVFEIYPASDSAAHSLLLTYYADVSIQSGGTSTVAALCPEALIYAATMEAAPFLKQSDEQLARMSSMFESALAVVNAVSDYEQVSGSAVRVEVPL